MKSIPSDHTKWVIVVARKPPGGPALHPHHGPQHGGRQHQERDAGEGRHDAVEHRAQQDLAVSG